MCVYHGGDLKEVRPVHCPFMDCEWEAESALLLIIVEMIGVLEIEL